MLIAGAFFGDRYTEDSGEWADEQEFVWRSLTYVSTASPLSKHGMHHAEERTCGLQPMDATFDRTSGLIAIGIAEFKMSPCWP